MAQHYKDLIAWQKAMDLVEEIYRITEQFPKREVYSLTDQIRRAAVSIPSNIAEGQAHYSKREFTHYLRHARGSLAELETPGANLSPVALLAAYSGRCTSQAS